MADRKSGIFGQKDKSAAEPSASLLPAASLFVLCTRARLACLMMFDVSLPLFSRQSSKNSYVTSVQVSSIKQLNTRKTVTIYSVWTFFEMVAWFIEGWILVETRFQHISATLGWFFTRHTSAKVIWDGQFLLGDLSLQLGDLSLCGAMEKSRTGLRYHLRWVLVQLTGRFLPCWGGVDILSCRAWFLVVVPSTVHPLHRISRSVSPMPVATDADCRLWTSIIPEHHHKFLCKMDFFLCTLSVLRMPLGRTRPARDLLTYNQAIGACAKSSLLKETGITC